MFQGFSGSENWEFPIPTRPCPIHPKQIRMGDVTHIIWILFIIRNSPYPGQNVAIVLPRDGE